MISQAIALYNHNNGVFMIGIFAAVCVALIAMLVIFMTGGKKK